MPNALSIPAPHAGGFSRLFGNLRIYFDNPSDLIAFWYSAENFKSEIAYVYAEDYSHMADLITCSATDGSGGIGQIYPTLSTNWYLCYRTG